MPNYLYEWRIWLEILPIPVLAGVVTILILFLSGEFHRNRLDSFLVVFSMAFLGAVTGLVTGQSRDPAVSAVVPAILSLISALTIYIVAAKGSGQQKLTSIVVITFLLDFLIGIHWGSHSRDEYEKYIASEEVLIFQEKIEQNLRLQRLLHEKQLNETRAALGLPSLSVITDTSKEE